jgi:hypothetical protein
MNTTPNARGVRTSLSLWERAGVRGVTVLGSYEGRLAIRILLDDQSFPVTAQIIGRPSPPTPLPEKEGKYTPSALVKSRLLRSRCTPCPTEDIRGTQWHTHEHAATSQGDISFGR